MVKVNNCIYVHVQYAYCMNKVYNFSNKKMGTCVTNTD